MSNDAVNARPGEYGKRKKAGEEMMLIQKLVNDITALMTYPKSEMIRNIARIYIKNMKF